MEEGRITTNELLLGGAIGALLAAGSIVFLRSKNTASYDTGIKGKYQEYKDNIEDFLLLLEDNIESKVSDKAQEWGQTVKDTSENLKAELGKFTGEEYGELKTGLLIGGLLGTVLGIEATKLYYSKEIKQSRFDVQSLISNNTGNWKNIVLDILEIAAGRTDRNRTCQKASNKVDDIVNIVDSGIQLWKRINK